MIPKFKVGQKVNFCQHENCEITIVTQVTSATNHLVMYDFITPSGIEYGCKDESELSPIEPDAAALDARARECKMCQGKGVVWGVCEKPWGSREKWIKCPTCAALTAHLAAQDQKGEADANH